MRFQSGLNWLKSKNLAIVIIRMVNFCTFKRSRAGASSQAHGQNFSIFKIDQLQKETGSKIFEISWRGSESFWGKIST